MPDHLRAYGDAWRRLHPDWEYRLWGDDDLGWLEHRDLFDQAPTLAPRNMGQFRSNIARVEILWREGGVYADCDMEPRRPIDPLLDDCSAFVAWHNPPIIRGGPIVGNAFIGAEQGHPAMRAVIDGLRDNMRANEGLRSVYTTGVYYFSRVLADRTDIVRYPFEYAYPYRLNEPHRAEEDFPSAYIVHHWNNSRSGGHTGRRA